MQAIITNRKYQREKILDTYYQSSMISAYGQWKEEAEFLCRDKEGNEFNIIYNGKQLFPRETQDFDIDVEIKVKITPKIPKETTTFFK